MKIRWLVVLIAVLPLSGCAALARLLCAPNCKGDEHTSSSLVEFLNEWSLSYLTIVGAYVIKGSRHDISTLVDLAVIEPTTRSLVLRAGGTDTRRGNSTLLEQRREAREASGAAFDAATQQMIENFDVALKKFQEEVRAANAQVRIVKRDSAPKGPSGGGGALDWRSLLILAGFCVWRRVIK